MSAPVVLIIFKCFSLLILLPSHQHLFLINILLNHYYMYYWIFFFIISGWSERYSQGFRGISSHKRSCTDLYCLAVLLIFICGWLAVGYYGITWLLWMDYTIEIKSKSWWLFIIIILVWFALDYNFRTNRA